MDAPNAKTWYRFIRAEIEFPINDKTWYEPSRGEQPYVLGFFKEGPLTHLPVMSCL